MYLSVYLFSLYVYMCVDLNDGEISRKLILSTDFVACTDFFFDGWEGELYGLSDGPWQSTAVRSHRY